MPRVTKTAAKKVVAKKVAAKQVLTKANSTGRVTVETKIVPRKPTPKFDTLGAWSYSVYTNYLKCPLSICFEKIQKIKIFEPENPAFIKGNRVHHGAETFIRTPTKELPAFIKQMQKDTPAKTRDDPQPKSTWDLLKSVEDKLRFFQRLKASVELEWAFTRDYKPTSWFGRDAWLRIKTDACGLEPDTKPPLIHITDWKTGKVYDEHKQQRSLYALGGLQLVELGALAAGDKRAEVIAEHAYTDTTQSATETFAFKDLKKLKDQWAARTKQMLSDTTYKATPGYHCKWCRYRKSNGGPCPEAQ